MIVKFEAWLHKEGGRVIYRRSGECGPDDYVRVPGLDQEVDIPGTKEVEIMLVNAIGKAFEDTRTKLLNIMPLGFSSTIHVNLSSYGIIDVTVQTINEKKQQA